MRLYVFLTFLIVLIIAVNAAQQNHPNKRTQLAKRKSTNGAVAANSNHLVKAKPRPRSASKSKKVRKVKPARKPISKKVVRRVVKKNNRRSNAPKKITRKGNRNNLRRGSRAGSRSSSRKRLAKQELSDSTENKSIGAGQANGSDLDTSSDKAPETTNNQAAPAKPVAAPVQPAVAKPAPVQPVASPPSAPATSDEKTSLLSSPAANGNPLSSSPFNIPKATGENQAIGAAFSQSSNGGSAFAAGFASIGKQNTAGGVGQVNAGKQASNPGSETLNSAEEPAASDTSSSADEGSNDQLAAYRRRPRHG